MTATDTAFDDAKHFYTEVLTILNEHGLNYMLGGGFAMYHYTGIDRDTKDLDIFCKAAEYPKILKLMADKGFQTELPISGGLLKYLTAHTISTSYLIP